jgi:hypothetical protein
MERERLHRRSIIEELEDYLLTDINGLDLETEITRQPALFYKAAQMLADVQGTRDRLKVELENHEADTLREVRSTLPVGTKITVAEVDALVRAEPGVRRLHHELAETSARHARMSALKEGFSSRGWSLRDMVELQSRARSAIDVEAHKSEVSRQGQSYYGNQERRVR